MATKKRAAPVKIEPVKFSVPLPPDVHLALAIHSARSGQSNSALIRALVEARFADGCRDTLAMLAPPDRQNDWKRVSVFLPPALKDRATHEVQRQHGAVEDKRQTGSLASAIAALVAAAYAPEAKAQG